MKRILVSAVALMTTLAVTPSFALNYDYPFDQIRKHQKQVEARKQQEAASTAEQPREKVAQHPNTR